MPDTTNGDFRPLVLHAHGTGPNPYKVAIALEILHLPYIVKVWDFGDGPEGVKGPTFLAINPNGRVPALEDMNTGIKSWESGACINYLVRTYDKQNLLGPRGDTEQDRVDYDVWTMFLISSLGSMMGQVNWFRHYHAQKDQNALIRYVAQANRTFDVVEGQLALSGNESVLPGGFCGVDVHLFPWVHQHDFVQLPLTGHPKIKAWLNRLADREEVKRAYEKIAKAEHATASAENGGRSGT